MGFRLPNMSKYLLLTLGLLALASATDVFISTYGQDSDCSGAASLSDKVTLDKCTSDKPLHEYSKITLSAATYTYQEYTDSDCSTPTQIWYNGEDVDSTPVTGTAGECTSGKGNTWTFTTGPDYPSAANTNDCTGTSGCPTYTGQSATNSASHASVGIFSVFLGLLVHWIA